MAKLEMQNLKKKTAASKLIDDFQPSLTQLFEIRGILYIRHVVPWNCQKQKRHDRSRHRGGTFRVKWVFSGCSVPPKKERMNSHPLETVLVFFWLVVEPTHLKNMLVKLDHLRRDRGEHLKNIWNHHLVCVWCFFTKNMQKIIMAQVWSFSILKMCVLKLGGGSSRAHYHWPRHHIQLVMPLSTLPKLLTARVKPAPTEAFWNGILFIVFQ